MTARQLARTVHPGSARNRFLARLGPRRAGPEGGVGNDGWQVVTQFRNDSDGSPPCEIKVGHGQYYLDGNNGAWHNDIGPAVTGQPIDIAVRVTFSADPAASVMDAWYNGAQTVTGAHPKGAGTLYDGQSGYLKTGIYRSPAIGEAGTRYLNSLVIGTPA